MAMCVIHNVDVDTVFSCVCGYENEIEKKENHQHADGC